MKPRKKQSGVGTGQAGQELSESTISLLSNVSLEFGSECRALDRVSLTFKRGVHYVLMGPSGSGKSSLLSCISGRCLPTSGQVTTRGRVATIHQNLCLVGEKGVLDNVLHGAMGRLSLGQTLCGFPPSERETALGLIKKVGLLDKLYTPVKYLSGGERQRVAIARALMQQPCVLLSDEPVAALDEENADEVMRLISNLAKDENIALVSVLHDYTLAGRYGDTILQLVKGQVVQVGSPEELSFESHGVTPGRDSSFDRSCSPLASTSASREEEPRKPRPWLSFGVAIMLLAVCLWSLLGLKVFDSLTQASVGGLLGFLGQMIPDSWSEVRSIPWATLLEALVETLQMAVVGTVIGVFISWPLAALGARNLGKKRVRLPVRFFLNTLRTIPSLIWALIFVAAVGLGTLAGVLALSAYSVGYLTKFFYEAFEGVHPEPPQALKEIGASGLQRFIHAVWPSARPAVLSSSFFMLEYNVRAASVLGVVDAGGIGFYMKQYIDFRALPSLFACLLLILAVVLVFDAASTVVRARLLDCR